MKFKIELNAEELSRGIESGVLAQLVNCDSTNFYNPKTEQKTVPAEPAAPVCTDEAKAKPADVSPVVPTETRQYSHDELAKAAMQLMDQGRQPELLGLLQEFGVQAVPLLPPDAVGRFAIRLREMGAQI